jgi:ABC-type transport system involved in cytochrome c biogenesis permease subunit
LAALKGATAWQNLLVAYAGDNPKDFNQQLDRYLEVLKDKLPDDMALASTEVGFNHFAPFYQCMVLYVIVFFVACLSWVWRQPALTWYAFGLGIGVLVIHSGALIVRMYLQGRPPVTNLYSSAVFIGWGAVLVGLVLEGIFRNGLAVVVAAVTGFLSLIVAQHLGGGGDTLEMMQAVLDTNFWLATHVTAVTTGYFATFVAGFLGMVYIFLGLLTEILHNFGQKEVRPLDRDVQKALGKMIYGIVCFATLFSFVGTVLGGIWADQSWGRFWGWDPKENGAVLIVIMNALILHARWGGMVKARGMAILAIVGNMVTAWSWFGTNQLGVGLHAYGFNKELATGCTVFWVFQSAMIGLGLLPLKAWNVPVVNTKQIPTLEPVLPLKDKNRRGSNKLRPKFT